MKAYDPATSCIVIKVHLVSRIVKLQFLESNKEFHYQIFRKNHRHLQQPIQNLYLLQICEALEESLDQKKKLRRC